MDQQSWLDQLHEDIVEPELPICDPHHHLWDHPDSRYLLDELLQDVGSGHNVVSTVFVECGSMYRSDGPEALRPVGETEFVNGVAAMSASGGYGDLRVCAGIVGFADLTLGAAVGEVLDLHMARSGRFRGIRHAAGWDADDGVRNSHTNPPPHLLAQKEFRAGMSELGKRGLSFDAWLYHTQIAELTNLARAHPDVTIVFDHFGGPLGIGPYADRREEIFPSGARMWPSWRIVRMCSPSSAAWSCPSTDSIFTNVRRRRALMRSSPRQAVITGMPSNALA
jgi:L-fuconolactonase